MRLFDLVRNVIAPKEAMIAYDLLENHRFLLVPKVADDPYKWYFVADLLPGDGE